MTRASLFSGLVGLAIVLLVAGLTHFLAILILPDVATKDAYTLLSSRAATDRITVLPPSRPGDDLIPFRDPAAIQGVCLFDLGKAPVRVRATAEEGRLLTLSFRTPDGRIFYSITDRAALHDKIDIRLLTDSQLKDVEAADLKTEAFQASIMNPAVHSRVNMIACRQK